MLVSYAQNREDLYLWALVGHRPRGTYVDVGCNHERVHSVTRLFYEQGWSGLNIDANDSFAPAYAERTRDTFVAAGVGAEPGVLTFRQYWVQHGLSTFDDVVKAGHDGNDYPYVDKEVPIRTLTDLIDDAGLTQIDFLKIDVEGMEPEVLRGLDLSRIRPTVIVVEAMRAADCEAVLFPANYRNEFFDGLNMYYLDNDATDVTMHAFSDRVLKAGYITDRERELTQGRLMVLTRAVQIAVGRLRAFGAKVRRDRYRAP